MGTFTHPRLPDWTIRWTEFIKVSLDKAGELKLDWEDITCTQWSGDGIEAITGHNPYEPFRGKHHGVMGACKAIKAAGFNSLDELIADLFEEVPLSMAHQGDLVLAKSGGWGEEGSEEIMPHAVGLADPPLYWAVTEAGLGKGDLYADGVRAFAVGRVI
jgi:hypothetical protein